MEDYTWVGMFVPAGTPAEIAQRLNDVVLKAAQAPEMRERLEGLTFEVNPAPLRETADYIRREVTKWTRVVRDTGAKVE
jgi:tripartite-type tricarboxylate transporter receptor subunit TctC